MYLLARYSRLNPKRRKVKSKYFISIVLFFLIFSCRPKINSEDEKTFAASVEKIKEGLSEKRAKEFDESLDIIMYDCFEPDNLLKEESSGNPVTDYLEKINGKTARNIIKEARRLKKN